MTPRLLRNFIRETVWDLFRPQTGLAAQPQIGEASQNASTVSGGSNPGLSDWIHSISGRVEYYVAESGYVDGFKTGGLPRNQAKILYRARGGEIVSRLILSTRVVVPAGQVLDVQLETTDSLFGSPTVVSSSSIIVHPNHEASYEIGYELRAGDLLIMSLSGHPVPGFDYTVEIRCKA